MTEPPSSDIEPSLEGRVIAVPEARQLDVLANLLEKRGARVLRCPLVGIKDAPDPRPVVAWIERLVAQPADLLVIYTGEGVERLLGFARRAGLEEAFVAALGKTPKMTRGPKPKRALRRLGLDSEYEAAEPTTHGLIETLSAIDLAGKRVAVQLYTADQDPELLDYLRDHGIEPDCVAPYVYASAAEDDQAAALIDELAAGRVDAIAFTSKSQVQRLVKLARERGVEGALRAGLERARVAAVGPIVAAELENLGFRVDAMPEDSFSMKPLVTALGELLGSA
ncbi:MAG TPA: uroporphyrinogen-III synthase [Gammaproteobacteria bacterium]|nr:uroporphyrinogen-III synthase [Gammaproteobacteria bacterium]